MKTRISPSAADLHMVCPSSIPRPEITIDQPNDAAALGSAVHATIAAYLETDGLEIDPGPHAYRYDVDPVEVERLASYAPRAMATVKEVFGDLQIEAPIVADFGAYVISGRMDLLSIMPGADGPYSINIIDWKTGRDSSHSKKNQMLAYAAAAAKHFGLPATGYVYTAEVWLREQTMIERRFDRTSINGLIEDLDGAVGRAGKVYGPGPHCEFCPHYPDCEARAKFLRGAVTALQATEAGPLTPRRVADLYEQSRALASALAKYDKTLRGLLESGPIERSDGSTLALVAERAEKIDARKAWPVIIEAGLTNDDIASALTMSKTKILAAASEKAKRGEKAQAKAALMLDLRAAGAVSETYRKSIKKIKP